MEKTSLKMSQTITIKLLKFHNKKEIDYLIDLLNSQGEIKLDIAGTHRNLLTTLKEIKKHYEEIKDSIK